jgi:hypothetical protein
VHGLRRWQERQELASSSRRLAIALGRLIDFVSEGGKNRVSVTPQVHAETHMSELPPNTVVVESTRDDVRAVAAEIRSGNCILFLGAGVHSRPPEGSGFCYTNQDRPLRGGELATELAGLSGYDKEYGDTGNLGRVSLYCEMKKGFGRARLIEEIRSRVQTDKSASPALHGLASLNFRYVATTNYDQLVEDAFRQAGKKPYVSVYNKSRFQPTEDYVGDKGVYEPTSKRPFVLKIHGDIDRPESLVVTDEDYIHFVLRMGDQELFHPVPASFRYGFARLSTLFIGYSLLDYNLRLLFKTLRWQVDNARMPKAYAVDPFPDRIIQDVYDEQLRFVQFIVLDVWSFVPMLYRELTGNELPAGVEVTS